MIRCSAILLANSGIGGKGDVIPPHFTPFPPPLLSLPVLHFLMQSGPLKSCYGFMGERCKPPLRVRVEDPGHQTLFSKKSLPTYMMTLH